MLVVVATMVAKAGKEAELEAVLKAIVPKVQNEEGTISYVLHRAVGEPGKFLFYEVYRDKAALDFHSNTPYFKEMFASTGALLEGRPQIALFEDIASISR